MSFILHVALGNIWYQHMCIILTLTTHTMTKSKDINRDRAWLELIWMVWHDIISYQLVRPESRIPTNKTEPDLLNMKWYVYENIVISNGYEGSKLYLEWYIIWSSSFTHNLQDSIAVSQEVRDLIMRWYQLSLVLKIPEDRSPTANISSCLLKRNQLFLLAPNVHTTNSTICKSLLLLPANP